MGLHNGDRIATLELQSVARSCGPSESEIFATLIEVSEGCQTYGQVRVALRNALSLSLDGSGAYHDDRLVGLLGVALFALDKAR